MEQTDAFPLTIFPKPPLIKPNGIQSDYELLGIGFALTPVKSLDSSMVLYDKRRVIGDLLGSKKSWDAIPLLGGLTTRATQK